MKIGILTINDNNNYGNRLQSYAMCKFLNNMGYDAENISNLKGHSDKNKVIKHANRIKISLKRFSPKLWHKRQYIFNRFNRNIKYSKIHIDENFIPSNLKEKYDYFITGSDQVWNPYNDRLTDIDLLSFADNTQKISLAASFGVSEMDKSYLSKISEHISNYKAISVREESGLKMIQDNTDRRDVVVLVDPTMMLTAGEWDDIIKKPKYLKKGKYILLYFLGKMSDKRMNVIVHFARERNYRIVDLSKNKNEFYYTGPSEFVYLEKNAELILTDSFHSAVFGIIFQKPFVVFEREDLKMKMNSRLDTLLKKFELKSRKYQPDKDLKEYMNVDYAYTFPILETEKEKFTEFVKKSIN